MLKKRAKICPLSLNTSYELANHAGLILNRVVVGASPFLPTTVACLAFVLIHWLLGWISLYNDTIGRWVKGEKSVLYENGKVNARNMRRARISNKDLLESLRMRLNEESFEKIKEIFIERGGEISVVKQKT